MPASTPEPASDDPSMSSNDPIWQALLRRSGIQLDLPTAAQHGDAAGVPHVASEPGVHTVPVARTRRRAVAPDVEPVARDPFIDPNTHPGPEPTPEPELISDRRAVPVLEPIVDPDPTPAPQPIVESFRDPEPSLDPAPIAEVTPVALASDVDIAGQTVGWAQPEESSAPPLADDLEIDWLADFMPAARASDDVEELLAFTIGTGAATPQPQAEAEPELAVEPEPEPEPATPRERAVALATRLGLAYVDLTEFAVDPTVVGMVNDQMARRHTVLPIARAADRIVVVFADPENVVVVDDISAMLRAPIVPVVAEPEAILAAIDRYHRVDSEVEELTSAFAGGVEAESDHWSQDVGDQGTDEAPIIRFVNLIISQAITDRASDIHIEPMRDELRVRYRIDGVLTTVQRVPRSMIPGVISRLKVMAELDIGERRKPQDGRISVTHSGRTIDLRVATLPTVWGEKVVARVLDSPVASLKLDDLGMLERNMEVFSASFSKPYGMILVTGPTGSGKSTTLYTTLATISKPTVNVITVEDPVEYRMPGINQVQVNMKAGMTFAAALRSILRSDPDVILIGEIRDEETAKIAIESSLTGHLVLSTLHTNDAPSSVTRLIEMGVEPFLVGSALDSVVAQRLARRLCERCKAPEPATETDLRIVGVPLGTYHELPTVYRPVGCAQCSKTGYRGRIALHEVMAVDEEIERLASRNSPVAEISAHAESIGMTRLRMDGWAKVLAGHTSVEEILRVTI